MNDTVSISLPPTYESLITDKEKYNIKKYGLKINFNYNFEVINISYDGFKNRGPLTLRIYNCSIIILKLMKRIDNINYRYIINGCNNAN